MKITRFMAVLLTLVLQVSLFSGCSGGIPAKTTTTSTQAGVSSNPVHAKEPVTVTVFIQKNAVDQVGAKLKEQFEAQNKDIKIEWNLISEDNVQAFTKMDMAVMSGDRTDVILLQNPNHYSKYVSGKLLMPLNDLAGEAHYDIEKIYGGYAKKYGNSTYYWLPDAVTMNIVYYNKKIFDDARVRYPTGKWTWDEYTETAKKLTDTGRGIYGSLMELDWEYYSYLQANQEKISPYKGDGTSSFDNPAWKDSLKWLNDLSAVHKIQPNMAEFKAKKLQFDSFMSGKFGMEMIGTWFLNIATDYAKYPRDWKIGVCAPPTPADGKNLLSAGGGFGINKSAAHPKEAFKVITYFCENEYAVNGTLPARVDIRKEDMLKVFEITSKKLKGEVTPEELFNACYPADFGVANEKIIGPASAQINDLYARESEAYLIGRQSLEDTMKNLKTKADDLIAKDRAAK